MPRTKAFKPEDVLQKAMLTFWQHGYEATSIADLEKALGITRFSIYSTFQDKEGLLLASLDCYAEMAYQFLDRQLDGGLEAIEALLHSFSSPTAGFPESCYGCLMVNMVLEGPEISSDVKARVQGYLQRLKQSFRAALARAQARQQLRDDLNLEDCADYLVSAVSGLAIVNRLANDKRASQTAVNTLISLLEGWKP